MHLGKYYPETCQFEFFESDGGQPVYAIIVRLSIHGISTPSGNWEKTLKAELCSKVHKGLPLMLAEQNIFRLGEGILLCKEDGNLVLSGDEFMLGPDGYTVNRFKVFFK